MQSCKRVTCNVEGRTLSKHLGVVMDPLESINPKKDSTLAMMEAAQSRGWQVSEIQLSGLHMQGSELEIHYRRVEVQYDLNAWFKVLSHESGFANDFDVILMRVDPPFNMDYVYATYLLEFAMRAGILVANHPGSIRDCNEKLFALQFPQCTPELVVTSSPETIKDFHAQHQDIILKPLDGMGGQSIFRLKPDDTNRNVIIETLTQDGHQLIMAQRYIPEIREGDTRILMINGKPVPYGLARIPSAGETRGNLAAGGSGVGRTLTDRDRWICDQVGPTLVEKGLYFVGLDVIGDYLTEINVTCPTCVRELNAQFDLDIAGDYIDFLSQRLDD